MHQIFASVVIVVGLALVALATRAVRRGRLSLRTTRIGAAVCGIGIAAMVLSDYPYQGNRFWADHSVLAAILSSLLMVGVVFLAYEAQERTAQQQLAVSLTGAGLGGMVDHIVDVEVALALATNARPPDAEQPKFWSGWDQPGRPLRWLRHGRPILSSADDPRLREPSVESPNPWSADLIDQAIRRLLAGMRDWSTLVGRSDDGTAVLVLMSEIRADLMALSSPAPDRPDFIAMCSDLKWKCRTLALCFESWSGAPSPRPEVLAGGRGLGEHAPVMRTDRPELDHRLATARSQLRGEHLP